MLEFERDVLTGAGAEVVSSMNAEEMKSLLQKQSFDALIVDGTVPGGGGARELYGWLSGKLPRAWRNICCSPSPASPSRKCAASCRKRASPVW